MTYTVRQVYSFCTDGYNAHCYHEAAQFSSYSDARDFQELLAMRDDIYVAVQTLRGEEVMVSIDKRAAA